MTCLKLHFEESGRKLDSTFKTSNTNILLQESSTNATKKNQISKKKD